jgi:D-alanyl-D-alanine dipeptidase
VLGSLNLMYVARSNPVAPLVATLLLLSATGCEQNKAAHASPAVQQQPLSSEGFCTEAPAAPTVSSCACEAPQAHPDASAQDAAGAEGPSGDQDAAGAQSGANAAPELPGVPALGVPSESLQALLVTTAGWNEFKGTAQRFEREAASGWRAVGEPVTVALGRRGLAWGRGLHDGEGRSGPVKREGDMKSPAGVFDLGDAYGYAPKAPEGTSWPYHRVTLGWKCIDAPRDGRYNTMVLPEGPFVSAPTVPWGGVRRDIVFDRFVMVRHNTEPVLRSAGSCVLLHPWINERTPTQGCTSMANADLQAILAWLSPKARPVLVQIPRELGTRN